MSLKKLTYSEYKDTPKHWKLETCDFSTINLVTGRNATGKSRLISVLASFCGLLSGSLGAPSNGSFKAEIQIEKDLYLVELEFSEDQTIYESVTVNEKQLLKRDRDGKGFVFYSKQNQTIDFLVDEKTVALQQRRDELQHPFIVALANWALGCEIILFGTGKSGPIQLSALENLIKAPPNPFFQVIVQIYHRAYLNFGDDFDKAIIRDMAYIDYKLTDVGAEDLRQYFTSFKNLGEPVIGMFVKEELQDFKLTEMEMSSGMLRALTLVIRINEAVFSRRPTLMLIDDIGEGLDFARSTKLVDLIIEHSLKSDIQLVMTSNDRFIMNQVPLKYWLLLKRKESTVFSFNERTNPADFKNFEYSGQSNFDFFRSNLLD